MSTSTTPAWCAAHGRHYRLSVQIQPNAKKSEVIAVVEDALKIRLQAQPVDGKANAALVVFIAGRLKVPKNAVTITHGHTAKRKLLEISAPGMSLDDVKQALLAGVSAAG